MTHNSHIYKFAMMTSALAWSAPAFSQNMPAPQDDDTIVVTGSLIARDGFSAPTPVSVLSAQDISDKMPSNMADLLNTMPQFGYSSSPTNVWSSSGLNTLNLRNLGSDRTLVLFDGQRIVASNTAGARDVNTLPLVLLKSVEIVTGGASAAYGADAVAGVVNFTIDRKFEGLKVTAQYGNTGQMDYASYKADLAVGTSFAGGRGHIVASASYLDNPQLLTGAQRSWVKPYAVVLNADYTPGSGLPQYIHVDNSRLASVGNGGGLIVSGPLAGTEFIGPDAVPIQVDQGRPGGGQLRYGGNPETIFPLEQSYGAQYGFFTSFANINYEVSDNITADFSLSYSKSWSNTPASGYFRYGTVRIERDNVFLPQQTQDAMDAAGITSFMMGTRSASIHDAPGRPYGMNYNFKRDVYSGTFRLSGDISGWDWRAFYTHAQADQRQSRYNNVHIASFLSALDSVRAPAGNAAGIPAGTIVCRSTLTNPNNGCIPYNPFGIRELTDAQRAYLTPVPYTDTVSKLDEINLQIQGEPFSNWAGPVSVAFGGSYRKESSVLTPDPLTLAGGFYSGNERPFNGKVEAFEGFGEVIMPLVVDQGWTKSLDLNTAIRFTDYSTSGSVVTWKVGLTNQVNDDILLRSTLSRDIRAPNLTELFNAGNFQNVSVYDPFLEAASQNITVTRGNRDLSTENARTFSIGAVFSPSFIDGLKFSLDYYTIKVKNAIESNGPAQGIVDRCFQGNTFFCGFIDRDANGAIEFIHVTSVNTAEAKSSGIDAELQYRRDMLGGTVELSVMGGYTIKTTSSLGGILRETSGSLFGADGGMPKLLVTSKLSYQRDVFRAGLTMNYKGSGKYSKRPELANIDDNDVPAIAYFDIDASIAFGRNGQHKLFGVIDNIFDQDPRIVPATAASGGAAAIATRATRGGIYDLHGRKFRVGVSAKF